MTNRERRLYQRRLRTTSGWTSRDLDEFIVDGSVFVTCAAINPTSTIQALALRSADWIARHDRELAA